MKEIKDEIKIMDFLKFKLSSSKMLKGVITKIVEKKIYEKFGYKVNIQINDIQIDIVDGEVKAHLDVDGKISKIGKTEFDRLIGSLNQD